MIAAGAGKLSLSSALVLARLLSCPAVPPPEVTLDFHNTPPQYANNKSSAELGHFRIDTTFSHGPDEIFSVGGLTESHIKSGFSLSYRALAYPGESPGSTQNCIWVDKISITVEYAPVIFIAQDYPSGTCRYGVTAQHELRHVNTDLITLREYLPKLKAAVQSMTRSLGVIGPVNANDIEKTRSLFMNVVRIELAKQADSMSSVRLMRQQQIDTRQEYLRLGMACPAEKK
jgi:hypothetical protein